MLRDYTGKEVSAERFAQVEKRWKEYWKQYVSEYPDADGSDYCEERECFMMEELGGEFKHM